MYTKGILELAGFFLTVAFLFFCNALFFSYSTEEICSSFFAAFLWGLVGIILWKIRHKENPHKTQNPLV